MVARAGANKLGLVAGGGALELAANLLDGGRARAGNLGNVALVGVDADEQLAVVCLDVLDDDIALAHDLAVAARAVQLAEVDDGEAVNGDGAQAVVLDDLVLGTGGTAASDGGVTVALEGQGVLADGLPPDVDDGAGALAVDTLDLVGTDNGVLEGGTVLKDEDGVFVGALGLARAAHAATVGLEATIKDARDRLGRRVGDGALGGGDGEGGAAVEHANGVGGDAGRGDGQRGGKESRENGRVLHFDEFGCDVGALCVEKWTKFYNK